MNEPQRGQVGVNPTSYNFDRFKVFDKNGFEITNAVIETYKNKIQEIYSKLPAFTSYGKEMVDGWVEEKSSNFDDSARQKYIDSLHDFISVINIENGFFVDHKIILKKVEFIGNDIKIDYVAIDNSGKPLDNQDALAFVVQNIVLLMIYENILSDEIETERLNRIDG